MSSFFHVVCNISTFDKWTEKHLAQASCIEFILAYLLIFYCPERAQLHTLGHISDTRKPLRPYIMVMYMPYFSRPLAKLNWRNGSIPFIQHARPLLLGTVAKLGHCTYSKRKSTDWKKALNRLKSWNTWPNCKSRWWAMRRTEVKFLLKSGIGKTPWSACTANNSGSGATWHHCKMESFQIPRYLP